MTELEIIKKKLVRQIAARKQAEQILESKALELFEANQNLSKLNESLENKIELRTEALSKSERKYRNILENMELGLLELDNDGLITKAFPRFCELLGYNESELLGKRFSDTFVLPEYIAVLEQQENDRAAGQEQACEIQVQRKDDAILWLMVSGAPYYDELGNQIGILRIHHDISESKKLRNDLYRSKLLAEQAQRAEQNFLANMSHEIRTPLNAIIGMSHLLSDTSLDADQNEYLDILTSSADLLQALIADILDISKIDSGNIELNLKPINLPHIIASIQKTFRVKLDSKPVEFIVTIDPEIDKLIIGDELLLRQVLLNLISNAEKFTTEGTIELIVKQISQMDMRSDIHFVIKDTGIGIDTSKFDLIFEEFKQATPEINKSFGGTGLGLAITKKLIHLMGGEIKVDSNIDKGTTFDFTLRFDSTAVEIEKGEIKSITQYEFSALTHPILIAEDNKMNQRYISKLMEKWKLDYIIADNGKIAVELAAKQLYQLIFMDIQMPEMNGYEATEWIRTNTNPNQQTVIVALTASTLLNKKQAALDIGMSDYLTKPYNPSQLLMILKKYLNNGEALKVELDTEVASDQVEEGLDYAYLEETYEDDYEYAVDMFSTFLEITKPEIIKLNEAGDSKNLEELSSVAHKIKPTFTMVGLPKISKILAKIESLGREGDQQNAEQELAIFNMIIERKMALVSRELEAYKTKLTI